MPIYKRCPRCRERISEGTTCRHCTSKRHKEYNRSRTDTRLTSFYWSDQWKKARAKAIDRFCGLDLYSLLVLKKLEYGETVHHIVPLEDDWTLRIDKYNLIYLTESNHQLLHKQMKDGKKEQIIQELRALVARWIDRGTGENVLEALSNNAVSRIQTQNSK